MRDVVTEDINHFSPDLTVPSADTWQAGITRALGTNMSIEARYVGARTKDNWRTNNYNEINIIENGFLDEFKLAMANLQANNAAGGTRAGSFAYYGPGTGTAPLPIFLAYFSGIGRDRAGDSALYTSNQFRCNDLPPDPRAIQSGSVRRGHRARRHGLGRCAAQQRDQRRAAVQLLPRQPRSDRRRRRGGEHHRNDVPLDGTGVPAPRLERIAVFRQLCVRTWQRVHVPVQAHRSDLGAQRWHRGDLTHAFKLAAVYSLPFGRGERWGGNVNGFVDRVIGGWQVAGSARLQSGRLLDLGNVRLVGMDRDYLQSVFKLRTNEAGQVFMFPQAIIDESFKAFSVSATTASGYGNLGAPSGRYIAPADSLDCIERIRGEGQCGLQSVVLTGPMFKQFDFGLSKRVEIVGRVYAEFRLDALNVFNNSNFVPVTGITTTNNRSTGNAQAAYEVTQLVGGQQARILQIVSRVRW